jgi:uncharacterized protein with GYD domain
MPQFLLVFFGSALLELACCGKIKSPGWSSRLGYTSILFVVRRTLQLCFCHQVSYTKEAWARLMQNPQDRLEAVRAPIEKLGGKMHTSFFAFGPFDVLAITEFPDNISAAAISIAFAAGGAVSNIQTTPLLTAAQAVEALRKAGTCGYKSITSETASSGTSAGH